MRSFALFLVLLTLIGFTTSFVRNFVPTANNRNVILATKQQKKVHEAQRSQAPLFCPQIVRKSMFLRSSEIGNVIDPSADVEYTKGMPDKAQFGAYYRSVVPFGSEMTKLQVK